MNTSRQRLTLSACLAAIMLPLACRANVTADTLSAPADTACAPAAAPLPTDTAALREWRETPAATKSRKSFFERAFNVFFDVDTASVRPNYYNWTLMLEGDYSFQRYQFSGRADNGHHQRLYFGSRPSFKVGPYIGWRFLFFGYTFNIGNSAGSHRDAPELHFALYTQPFGFDFIYQHNKRDFNLRKFHGFGHTPAQKELKGKNFSGLRSSITSLNVYYIFNHRRFSYPAAFSQTNQQLRSHGSWKAGFQYTHQSLKFDYTRLPQQLLFDKDGNPALIDQLKFSNVDYYDYSLNVGYAYNWVFAPNWLADISFSPAIGYKHTKGEQDENRKFSYYMSNINIDFITRLGLVWNNGHIFGGSSFVVHAYTYHKERFSATSALGYMTVYAGFYFGRKKEYKGRKIEWTRKRRKGQ